DAGVTERPNIDTSPPDRCAAHYFPGHRYPGKPNVRSNGRPQDQRYVQILGKSPVKQGIKQAMSGRASLAGRLWPGASSPQTAGRWPRDRKASGADDVVKFQRFV